jgi:hypothetical protein
MDQGLKTGDLTIPEAIAQFNEKWDAHVQFVPGGVNPRPVPWSVFAVIGLALAGGVLAAKRERGFKQRRFHLLPAPGAKTRDQRTEHASGGGDGRSGGQG